MGEVYMDSDHYIFIPHGDKFSIWLTPPQAKWTNPGRHRGLAEEPKEVYLFHFSAILYTIFCSLFKVREWVEGQCGKEKLLANKEDDSIWEAPGLESFFFFFNHEHNYIKPTCLRTASLQGTHPDCSIKKMIISRKLKDGVFSLAAMKRVSWNWPWRLCPVGRVRLTSTHLRGICADFALVLNGWNRILQSMCTHTQAHTHTLKESCLWQPTPASHSHQALGSMTLLANSEEKQRLRDGERNTWHWGDARSWLHLGWGGGTQKMESSSFSWQPTSVRRKPILWGPGYRGLLVSTDNVELL